MPKKKVKEEQQLDPNEIRDAIKSNDKFKSFRRIVKNIAEQVNIDKLHAEILRLHSGRKSRTLYLKRPGVDEVNDANLQDSSYRSRIAEIYVEVDYHLGMLEEALDAIRKHLMNEFRDNLESLKTKGERMAFADQYLTRGVSLAHKLKRLLRTADVILKDIDQQGFSFKNTIKTLEIHYSHRNDKKNI